MLDTILNRKDYENTMELFGYKNFIIETNKDNSDIGLGIIKIAIETDRELNETQMLYLRKNISIMVTVEIIYTKDCNEYDREIIK